MRMRMAVVVGIGAVLLSCQPREVPRDVSIEHINSAEAEKLRLPFSEAVRVGEMLYLSGQIGNIPGGVELPPGGIGPETMQALENIRAVLERNGSSMKRVVKCTVFLADIGEWGDMNEVYTKFFSYPPPARSAVGVSGIALGARVEIECLATAG